MSGHGFISEDKKPERPQVNKEVISPNIREGKCKGVVGFFVEGAANAIKAHFDHKVDDAEYNRRREICQNCTAIDSNGHRFFRDNGKGKVTCGAPFFDKIVRDKTKEGCGCYLKKKWRARDESCPIGLW